MFKTLTAAAAMLIIANAAQAQIYQTIPNTLGGSTTYGPNGYQAMTVPSFLGGSTIYVTPSYQPSLPVISPQMMWPYGQR